MKNSLIILIMAAIAIGCSHKELKQDEPMAVHESAEVQDSETESAPKTKELENTKDKEPDLRSSAKSRKSPCSTIVKGCEKDCNTYRPVVLYLGGGKARDLFDKYLSENKSVRERIPLTFKIRFYEKNGSDLKLETIGLEPWSLIGIDSRSSVLNMFKKQMGEKIAEALDERDLIKEARQEKADLFICSRMQSKK